MSKTTAPDPIVQVVIITDGLVIDGVSRRKGEKVNLAKSLADEFRQHARVKPLPLLRCLVPSRLIGHRVCRMGEEAYAPSVGIAREYHAAGVADWLNAEEMGENLPARRGDRPKQNPDQMKLRALMPCLIGALFNPNVREGQEFEVPMEEAMDILKKGLAEPVGWTLSDPVLVAFNARLNGL